MGPPGRSKSSAHRPRVARSFQPTQRTVTISVGAPAKINLNLRIVGRRPDGFHELRTLLQSIQLHDTLLLRSRLGPMIVRSRTPGVPKDRANLVWKSACVLWAALGRPGRPRDVAVSIRKAIPMAAGLGGGSSDAASALRGLCELWGVSSRPRWLRAVASRIGSDVPFFLDGGAAVGEGRGERIRRVGELDPFWVVLAVPRFCVSTAGAYRWFDAETRTRPVPRRSSGLPRGWRHRMEVLVNDLQASVARKYPEIRLMVEKLRGAEAVLAGMTGSGSVVFGLFAQRSAAEEARRFARQPGWRTMVTRTTNRTEFAQMTKIVRIS